MEIGKSTLNNLIFAGMFVLLVSCSHSPTSNQGDVQSQGKAISKTAKKSDNAGAGKNSKNSATNQFNNNWSNAGEKNLKNKADNQAVVNTEKNENNSNNMEENAQEGADVNNDTSEENLGQEQLANVQNNPVNSQVPLNQVPNQQVIQNSLANSVPINSAPVNNVPAAPAVVAAIVPVATAVSADVLPTLSELKWIGYNFIEAEKILKIELVTTGKPQFELFQESNKSGQPELVVRFKQTSIRKKIRRDIDASEFRSPVAFIRSRFDGATGNTDVILTLRDEVQPRLYAKDGNVLLTYTVPGRYFGPDGSSLVPVTTAQILPTANVSPIIDQGSDQPGPIVAAYVPDPGKTVFSDAPENGGVPLEQVVQPVEAVVEATADANGLPEDFSNAGPQQAVANPAANNFDMNNPMPVSNNGATNGMNFNNSGSAGGKANAAPENSQFNNGSTVNPNNGNAGSQEDSEFEEEDDNIDDFNDGEGESTDSNEKFEVRWKVGVPALVYKFSSLMVAQDNGEDAEFNENMGNGGGDLNQGNVGQNSGGQNNGGQNNGGQNNGGQNNAPVNNFIGSNTQGQSNSALVNEAPVGNAAAANANANPMFTNNGAANPALSNGALVSNPAPVDLSNSGLPSETPVLTDAPLPATDLVGTDVGTNPVQATAATPAAADDSVMGVNKIVNLDFRGAPLGEVIRVLSDESGINFLYEPAIGSRSVYVRLKGVTLETALNGILETYGLGMVTLGPKLIRIDTITAITQDRRQLQDARQTAARLAPTKIMIMRLNYLTAERAVALAQGLLQGGAGGAGAAGGSSGPDPRIRITSETRTNSMIIEATEADLGRVKAMMERLDIQTPQIKIASKLVAVRKSNTHEIGVSWTNGELNYDQRAGLGFGNLTFPNSMQANYAVDPGQVQGNGSFGFRFGSINNVLRLDMLLRMAETRGVVETLQNSEIIVEDNISANVTSGVTDVFPQQAGTGTNAASGGLSSISYNTSVAVTPRVTNDGKIQMVLLVTNNEPTPPSASSVGAAAGILNRSVTTTMMRRSGETAVIAGTFADNKTKTQRGIPWLSWMPIIGALFRSTVTQDSQTENVFLITPTILSGGSEGDRGASTYTAPLANNYGEENGINQGTLNSQSNNSNGQSNNQQSNNSENQENNAPNANNSQNNGSQNSQNSQNSENQLNNSQSQNDSI